jgi:hypothetical protein
MSNYRTTPVRLVNECLKLHNQRLLIPRNPVKRTNPPPCTPAPAESSTKKFRVPPATGRNARPRRNLAIHAAADPVRQGEKHATAAATGPGAINPAPDPVAAVKFLKTCRDNDQPSEDLRTAQRLYGCGRSVRALDNGPGIPHLFSLEKKLFAGHIRVFPADISEPDLPLPVQEDQNRTGKRPIQPVPCCTEIPGKEVAPGTGKKWSERYPESFFLKHPVRTLNHRESHIDR